MVVIVAYRRCDLVKVSLGLTIRCRLNLEISCAVRMVFEVDLLAYVL